MSINPVAIIVHEDEEAIKTLAQKMHIWVVATDKNKVVVEKLWQSKLPEGLTATFYEVPSNASAEEMCAVKAIDLVEDHHSSVFNAEPWLEIQVHGCGVTKTLLNEFHEFSNVKIEAKEYGFNVIRPSE